MRPRICVGIVLLPHKAWASDLGVKVAIRKDPHLIIKLREVQILEDPGLGTGPENLDQDNPVTLGCFSL